MRSPASASPARSRISPCSSTRPWSRICSSACTRICGPIRSRRPSSGGRARAEEIRARERVEEIIEFLEIERLRDQIVGTLSYGQQKRVELGRALAV